MVSGKTEEQPAERFHIPSSGMLDCAPQDKPVTLDVSLDVCYLR